MKKLLSYLGEHGKDFLALGFVAILCASLARCNSAADFDPDSDQKVKRDTCPIRKYFLINNYFDTVSKINHQSQFKNQFYVTKMESKGMVSKRD